MIKVISFDIGGTLLISNNSNIKNYSLRELAKVINKDYDKVRNAYKKVFQKQFGTFKDLVSNFYKELEISGTKEIEIFLKEKFENENGIISKDNKELIKDLKNKGYKIILFSNNCCLSNNNLDNDILKYIDDIFYSYDLGYTKNESESYRIIENKMGYKSNEFLHIGDTLKSDYLVPIENGWNALYFGSCDDCSIKTINNLFEIYKYL